MFSLIRFRVGPPHPDSFAGCIPGLSSQELASVTYSPPLLAPSSHCLQGFYTLYSWGKPQLMVPLSSALLKALIPQLHCVGPKQGLSQAAPSLWQVSAWVLKLRHTLESMEVAMPPWANELQHGHLVNAATAYIILSRKAAQAIPEPCELQPVQPWGTEAQGVPGQ